MISYIVTQVLSEVAVYKPPDASSNGTYSLRPECWDQFDPWYLHYTPQRLRSAVDNALQAGLDPASQLRELLSPPVGLPALYCHLRERDTFK